MATEGQRMKAALKKVVVPALENMGFSGPYPHFRRRLGDVLQLVSIQFGKYGGSFLLEAGCCAAGDMHTSWGDVVPETKIDVAYAGLEDRVRLHQRVVSGAEKHWFEFSTFGEEPGRYLELANHVRQLLPQFEQWFAYRVRGPNLAGYSEDA